MVDPAEVISVVRRAADMARALSEENLTLRGNFEFDRQEMLNDRKRMASEMAQVRETVEEWRERLERAEAAAHEAEMKHCAAMALLMVAERRVELAEYALEKFRIICGMDRETFSAAMSLVEKQMSRQGKSVPDTIEVRSSDALSSAGSNLRQYLPRHIR